MIVQVNTWKEVIAEFEMLQSICSLLCPAALSPACNCITPNTPLQYLPFWEFSTVMLYKFLQSVFHSVVFPGLI